MQLTSRLTGHVNDLTVQVIKEDWSRPSGPPSPSPAHTTHLSPAPHAPGPSRHSYEPRTSKMSPLIESTTGLGYGGPAAMFGGAESSSNSPGPHVGHYSLSSRLQQDSHLSQQL